MKAEINELPQPVRFIPYQIVLTVENYQEERCLAELYNHNSQIANLIEGYRPGVRPDHGSTPCSEDEIRALLLTAFKQAYIKVYS